jgi:hypothetical protein
MLDRRGDGDGKDVGGKGRDAADVCRYYTRKIATEIEAARIAAEIEAARIAAEIKTP